MTSTKCYIELIEPLETQSRQVLSCICMTMVGLDMRQSGFVINILINIVEYINK